MIMPWTQVCSIFRLATVIQIVYIILFFYVSSVPVSRVWKRARAQCKISSSSDMKQNTSMSQNFYEIDDDSLQYSSNIADCRHRSRKTYTVD